MDTSDESSEASYILDDSSGSSVIEIEPPKKMKIEKPSSDRCTFCTKKFKPGEIPKLEDHLKNNKCSICNRTFMCQSRLATHQKLSTTCSEGISSSSTGHRRCSFCKKSFARLISHVRNRRCGKCECEFRCFGLFLRHKKTCQKTAKNRCMFCQDVLLSYKEHYEQNRKCNICRAELSCATLYHEHAAVCSAENAAFVCKKCKKPLSSKQNLQKHKQLRICDKCSIRTNCYNDFSIHLQNCNEIIRPKCNFCATEQDSEHALENHSRSVNCPRCGFEQACSTLLARHLDVCRFDITSCSKTQNVEQNKNVYGESSESDLHKKLKDKNAIGKKICDFLLSNDADPELLEEISSIFVKKEDD
ncbi:putative zinc finger protein 727 [Neocloeon triangulifer]|uniref:putative zinc finger protein 727 n=1 Tax=Neocloeon triangulifer TaxID=2078957 RepID=UPI00286F8119|nr:putative zinc finger protein 727 [Neocloeon triangulifer]